MPPKFLLSTEATVSEEPLPVATKRRLKAENVRPYVESTDGDGGGGGGEQKKQQQQGDTQHGAKKQKLNNPREKKFACTYSGCDKIFNRPCRLTQHLNTHTNLRPFTCTYPSCGKSFFRNTHLRAHINSIHENIRAYTCTVEGCTQAFTTAQHMKRHVLSHEAKHPHACGQCEETFRKKTQLERHTRTVHLGLKPFACRFEYVDEGAMGGKRRCMEAFETKGKLEGHVQREHRGGGGPKYFCEECLMEDGEDSGGYGGVGGQGGEGQGQNNMWGGVNLDWISTDSIMVWPEDDDGQLDPAILSSNQQFFNIDNPTTAETDGLDISSTINPVTASATPNGSSSSPLFTASTAPSSAPPPSTTANTLTTRLGFKTYSELQSHIRLVHPPICRTCSKVCKSNRDLRAHIAENHADPLHVRKGNFVCGWVDPADPLTPPCAQGFPRRWGLLLHQRTVHEKLKPFGCPFDGCGRRFGYKSSMEGHYAGHFVDKDEERLRRRERRLSMASAASGSFSSSALLGGGAALDAGVGSGNAPSGSMLPVGQGQNTTTDPLLLTKLTGVGYAGIGGRVIPCVVEACEFLFKRRYDLVGHLRAIHAFGDRQIVELVGPEDEGVGGVGGLADGDESSGSEFDDE